MSTQQVANQLKVTVGEGLTTKRSKLRIVSHKYRFIIENSIKKIIFLNFS